MREYITYLHKTLAYPSFRRIWRNAFDKLQDLIWHELLLKQDFTTLGAARLLQDLDAIQSVVDVCVSGSRGVGLGMPKLREGVSLLNLPMHVEEGSGSVSLIEASSKIYATNTQAGEILKKLGFSQISNAEAREILARRVEASE